MEDILLLLLVDTYFSCIRPWKKATKVHYLQFFKFNDGVLKPHCNLRPHCLRWALELCEFYNSHVRIGWNIDHPDTISLHKKTRCSWPAPLIRVSKNRSPDINQHEAWPSLTSLYHTTPCIFHLLVDWTVTHTQSPVKTQAIQIYQQASIYHRTTNLEH